MSTLDQHRVLSVHRAFLIRLYSAPHLNAGEIAGRIEHVVSGETMEFCSVNDLVRSITHLLRREDLAAKP